MLTQAEVKCIVTNYQRLRSVFGPATLAEMAREEAKGLREKWLDDHRRFNGGK